MLTLLENQQDWSYYRGGLKIGGLKTEIKV